MTHPDTTTALLEDLHWLRRFAQILARDADETDDLVQDALVAAWRHGPDREGSLRPWLATVVRNLFRMRLRADARRESREQKVEGPAYAPDPDLELELLTVLKVLLSEIEALPADDQRVTMVIGEPADEAEKERRQFEAIVGAHVREIQFCEKKAPGSPRRSRSDRLTTASARARKIDRTPSTPLRALASCRERWSDRREDRA